MGLNSILFLLYIQIKLRSVSDILFDPTSDKLRLLFQV